MRQYKGRQYGIGKEEWRLKLHQLSREGNYCSTENASTHSASLKLMLASHNKKLVSLASRRSLAILRIDSGTPNPKRRLI